MEKYILALDQGTTSSRAVLFDLLGRPITSAQLEFKQYYPQPGWVEHDCMEILSSQYTAIKEVLRKAAISPNQISAIGIANQRETVVCFDGDTGLPLTKAIVWQCRRTADLCEKLKKQGDTEYLKKTTGLVPDAYFSATKMKWILDNEKSISEKNVKFGTVDSWLLYNLTGGEVFATDYSNASRTMLFDINRLDWDETLLYKMGLKRSMLAEVYPSAHLFGYTDCELFGNHRIPICGIAGDQQSALFGQGCFSAGEAKNTYGTGCFILLNTGEKPVESKNGLLTTIAWGAFGSVEYALEGSVYSGGCCIQWIRDELGLIKSSVESEQCANAVSDTGGVYLVPAFTGLGAPYWDMYARGVLCGLTRGSNKNHIVRAALEAIAYQSKDIFDAIEKDSGIKLSKLKVDGGASMNNFLMQFQSDILGTTVVRPSVTESTALGAAFLAMCGAGIYNKKEELLKLLSEERRFEPSMDKGKVKNLLLGWEKALSRALL